VRRADEAQYRDFVVARLDRLRRSAYLLCRDWHTADDLVSITLTKLYRNWSRATAAVSLDGYVRSILAHAWVDETRRSWRREDSTAEPPDVAGWGVPADAVLERAALAKLLTELPDRQRAVIVLRFYCDMSVAETADVLGVSEGTVKSQSARGLELLRAVAPQYALGEDQ
jgi:RNA polymerase sigma-70 factor (sigma-E family)